MGAPARQNDIQWLRAIAAIEVVLWHSDLITKHFSPANFQQSSYQLLGGFGVELFFIVSGYVICLQSPRYKAPAAFLYARFARLAPMYWLFTSLVILAYVINPNWRLGSFDLSATNLFESYLIVPQYEDPILGVGWSLEHEVIFYLTVAAVIGVGGNGIRPKLILPAILCVLGLIGLVLGTGPKPKVWDFQICSPYMLLFAFGWTMCCAHHGYIQKRHAIIALAAVGAFALILADPKEQILAGRMVALCSLFVLFTSARKIFETDTALNRMVSHIADSSYSLYLSHWFILSILGKILGVFKLPSAFDIPVRLVAVSLCVVGGLVIFRYIEKPFDRLLRPRRDPDQPSTPPDRAHVAITQQVDGINAAPVPVVVTSASIPRMQPH